MSIVLNGSTQYARVALAAGRSSANPWTFFCMVKFDNLAKGANQTFFGVHRNDTSGGFKYISHRMLDASDTLAGRFRPDINSILAEDTGLTLSTGTWYRVLIQWDETNKEIGVKVDSRTMVKATGSHADATMTDLNLGCSYDNTASWGGPSDFHEGEGCYYAYWDSLLTTQQIADLTEGTTKPGDLSTTPTHLKGMIGSQTGGGNVGTDYTLFGSPTINSTDPWATGAYTLTADSGSYAITGTDAVLQAGRQLAADSGSYTITGTDITLSAGLAVLADSGAYSVTGTNATLAAGRAILADSGAYSMTGANIGFSYGKTLSLVAGSYTISGTVAGLSKGYKIATDSGAYVFTGADVILDYSGASVWTIQADSSDTWTAQTDSSDAWTIQ